MKRALRLLLLSIRVWFFKKYYRMNLGKGVLLSSKCNLDKTNPRGIHIGSESYIAFGSTILSHDFVRGLQVDTKIGSRCFIGANSIILPGINVGHNSIIAAGSVVTKNVDANTIVAGNPAKTIKHGIKTGRYGKLLDD